MAFQFTPCANPEIATIAYEMPALPCGTSYSLRQLINNYSDAIRELSDGSADQPYSEVANFKPQSLSDVIAKVLIQLHFDNTGLDGDRLVLAIGDEAEAQTRVMVAGALLADLYSQLPQDWNTALSAYRAALLAEHDYDRRVWTPGYEAEKGGRAGNSDAVEREMERLQDVRCNAEALLLDMPAPSLTEFSIKYLICFDNDCDHNGWHADLCKEAKRLLLIESDPAHGELETMLKNLIWGE